MTRSDASGTPPRPFDSERAAITNASAWENDEWPAVDDNFLEEPELDPTRPREPIPHFHQLCGHACNSGACESELNAICLSCELVLQEDLDRRGRKSHGMNRPESD